LARLGRAPARPCRLTGGFHLSATTPPPRALSHPLSLPSGARLSAPVFSPARPSSLFALRARFASRRAVTPARPSSLSLRAVGLCCQLRLPRARRGPARAHSRTSPGTSDMSSAHTSQLFLSAARTRTHFPASFHAAPLSLALCPRRPISPETRARLCHTRF
jgi:hypothetical protein